MIGYVYVIDIDGHVKIGASKNPRARINTLSKTLGLKNPKFHISELCVNYFRCEKLIQGMFEKIGESGEFYNANFKSVASAINENVHKATEQDIKKEEERASNSEVMIGRLTKAITNTESENYKLLKAHVDIRGIAKVLDVNIEPSINNVGGNYIKTLELSVDMHGKLVKMLMDMLGEE